MKIGFIIDTLAMGGAERVAVITACELSRRGHEVTVICYHPRNDFYDVLHKARVRIVMIDSRGISRWWNLRRAIDDGMFTVIHAFKAPGAVWGLAASVGLSPCRWFAGQHALSSDSLVVRLLMRLWDPLICGWIVPSGAAAAVVRRDYGRTTGGVHIISNPVEVATLQRTRSLGQAKSSLGIHCGTAVITMVANLHPWKNYSLFLRLAKEVSSRNANVLFLSVGRDYCRGEIQAECSAMKLSSHVRFLGYSAEVAGILEATDVSVVTSPQESFCLAIAEAGAMEVPCVSVDNGGASEVIENRVTGFIVPVEQEDVLVERVMELLRDPPLRRKMGLLARAKVVGQCMPESTTAGMMKVYMGLGPHPEQESSHFRGTSPSVTEI